MVGSVLLIWFCMLGVGRRLLGPWLGYSCTVSYEVGGYEIGS